MMIVAVEKNNEWKEDTFRIPEVRRDRTDEKLQLEQ